MIKRISILFTLIVLSNVILFSNDLKGMIGIVEAEQYQAISNAFSRASEIYSEKGDMNRANAFDALPNSWFGSGFIIKTDESQFFLVTNRHVVDYSESLTFNIMDRRIPITAEIYAPDYSDIALIPLDNSQEDWNDIALTLSTEALKDGEQVWAAGYPGIGGTPVWQLSYGVITNRSVTIDELNELYYGSFIQHSASVDPGSSGGPLLRQVDDQYHVIGINTLSINQRSNTFFSIPNETLHKVLEDYRIQENQERREKLLEDSLALLLADFNGEEINVGNSTLVSEELLQNSGYALYEEIRKSILPSNSHQLEQSFFMESPLDTMKEASYFYILREYQEAAEPWRLISNEIELVGDTFYATSQISSADEGVELQWIYEKGNWRIRSIPGLDELPDPLDYDHTPQVDHYSVEGSILRVIFTAPTMAAPVINYGLGYSYRWEIKKPVYISAGLVLSKVELPQIDVSSPYNSDSSTETASGTDLSLNLSLGGFFETESILSMKQMVFIELLLGSRSIYLTDMLQYDSFGEEQKNILIIYPYIGLRGSVEYRLKPNSSTSLGLFLDLTQNFYYDYGQYEGQYDFPDYFMVSTGGILRF